MARDAINIQYLKYDATDSVGSIEIAEQEVNQTNGIVLKNAFACKDNSLKIVVVNSGEASSMTIKAGDKQNAILGDSTVVLGANKTTVVAPYRDMARYEKADGSIDLDFAAGFTGKIYAVGEKAGLGS